MAQLKFGSAGVTTREIDISGPITRQPVGIPAGIVGTALNGPAFVPVTVGNLSDWYSKFGETDGKKFGPLAVIEWLRNAQAVTYLRVLGVGDGRKRNDETGKVTSAGFVVGEQQPDPTSDVQGQLDNNPYANATATIPVAGEPASMTIEITGDYSVGEDGYGFSFSTPAGDTVNVVIDDTTSGATTATGPLAGVYTVTIHALGGITVANFGAKLADIASSLYALSGTDVDMSGGFDGVNTVTLTFDTAGATPNGSVSNLPAGGISVLSLGNFADGIDPYTVEQNATLGRTYFLGCFMSESEGSTYFSEAGIQNSSLSLPIVRGMLMAPSGVVLRLSSSLGDGSNLAPSQDQVAVDGNLQGFTLGDVVLSSNSSPKQEFVLFLNGHKGTNALYPNAITASFDVTANNYIAKALNTDPYKLQEAGHYLYANWDIHPQLAVVTGSGVIKTNLGAGGTSAPGREPSAFLLNSSEDRNDSAEFVPNYESFEDRYGHAKSPWFVSQKFGGKPTDLFRFHALDDGTAASIQCKISIENITPSRDPLNKYGSFNVVLREWTDRDLDLKNLPNEVFAGVNLDPSSDRYISKVIGDVYAYYDFDREESAQKFVIEGNYENRSNYIRVEVHPDVENGFVDPTALPLGFRGIDHLITSGSMPLQDFGVDESDTINSGLQTYAKAAVTPPLPFRRKITTSSEWTVTEAVQPRFYWGVHFEHPESLARKNSSTLPNASLKTFAKYFPTFSYSGHAKFLTGSNVGQPDSDELGVIDADRFCNNFFSLENIQVVTGSNGLADPNKWVKAVYCRAGKVTSTDLDKPTMGADADKVRGFVVDDLTTNRSFAKYTTIMQGGFNGVNIFDEDEYEINQAAVSADMDISANRGLNEGPNVRAYLKALDIMKNTVTMDIQLLAIPGIREPVITDSAILAVQERFDAMYVMDIEQYEDKPELIEIFKDSQLPSVSKTLEQFKNRQVDSSFAAAYFPDILYRDPSGVNLQVPPSVVVMGALALNDAVGHPWFAPAGFTRGALPDAALEPRVRLSQKDMDQLYDNSINPIVTFPGVAQSGTNPRGGVIVWGQKTLQVAASALDRVNVRRLLIEIRRQVRDIAQTILFEPNREATLARFSAAVTPRLQRIQALSGLERFKVIIDSSTTTQDDIENNTIRGKIFVQPTKSIEFVSLDFIVANNLQQVG